MQNEQRLIALEGSSNFRDIGGYATDSGQSLRWGIVYRSGALLRLTPADWGWMKARRIAAICDLRSEDERELGPTQWPGEGAPQQVGATYATEQLLGGARAREDHTAGVGEMEERLYPLFAELLAPSFAGMFNALAEGCTPIIVHCTAGQDRTGLAIGLLLSVLGVPEDVILEDYALSTQWRRPENELDRGKMIERQHDNAMARYFQDAYAARGAAAYQPRPLVDRNGVPHLAKTLAEIRELWGSIETFLARATGIDSAKLDRVRSHCLD
ncbi:tyrosine-protein phosphatase [Novosphingobium rosa]|uniref:tyrosine-protein phosphatase n=1 Tax=Novosphingobium rosa TaxID=76978 RepID=UPI00083318C4|nr:tyrosine-protein phosphatase [Novosphingobium rosa]